VAAANLTAVDFEWTGDQDLKASCLSQLHQSLDVAGPLVAECEVRPYDHCCKIESLLHAAKELGRRKGGHVGGEMQRLSIVDPERPHT
jgi:hypothetical protein